MVLMYGFGTCRTAGTQFASGDPSRHLHSGHVDASKLAGLHRATKSQDVHEYVELAALDANGDVAVIVVPFHVLHESCIKMPYITNAVPPPLQAF